MDKTHFLVKETPGCGKGVFTTRSFQKDEVLFTFAEKIVPWAKANHRSVQLGKNKWLNPSKDDLGYYLNHSCNPNARFKAPHFIAALQPIHAKEEITIDYSTVVNTAKWDMQCACGNANCRKLITSYSKSPVEIQEKYKDIISFKQ